MLKKTLLATSAISATLFAIAAVLPALAQSLSGGTSSTPTATAQTLASAPAQDKRQANDAGRFGKLEHRRDRKKIEKDERDGCSVAARVGAGADDSFRSAYKGTKATRTAMTATGPNAKSITTEGPAAEERRDALQPEVATALPGCLRHDSGTAGLGRSCGAQGPCRG